MFYLNLFYTLVAVVMVFGVLRLLDKFLGVKFRDDMLPIIKSDPLALSVFRGAWVIGACLLAGKMLGV